MFPTLSIPFKLHTAPIFDDRTKFRVTIAKFPGNNQEHPASSGWIAKTALDVVKDDSVSDLRLERFVGTPVTASRNRAVIKAIATKSDYLLMIDSDMEPDIEIDGKKFWDVAWKFMMNRRARERANMHDRAGSEDLVFDAWWSSLPPCAIGAPYCGPSPKQEVYVMKYKERNGSGHPDSYPKLTLFGRHEVAHRSGIEKVAALPTGLVLIDVRMFFYMPVPWFAYEHENEYHAHVKTTEDVYWGRNATHLGMPQYVAWDCWAGHHKLECVGKPRPVTVDNVNDDIVKAIRLNLDARSRLHFVNRDA